jgi:LPPG:FO 2-phospho-L-lactate transferase
VVALLAGGSGGAKLARGMLDVVGPDGLTVIANTGDDVDFHGVHVSPDPDLVTYWLADEIDERGWGMRGDTWKVMEALEAAGEEVWFRLGDRDLALCLLRTGRLRAGVRLTEANRAIARALGVTAVVLPMTDEPVRTHVRSDARWLPFQHFMILAGGADSEAPIEGVELRGLDTARPTPEVLDALESADAIVLGPSNPIISVGPILAIPGMSDSIAASRAAVVAVSPFVGGRALKGPTEAFMSQAGLPLGAEGVARAYEGVIDGLVADEDVPDAGVPVHVTDTLMDTPDARRSVAEATLDFAASLERTR